MTAGELRLVRERDGLTLSCPSCGADIALTAIGARWSARSPASVANRMVARLGGLSREEMHVLVLDVKCQVVHEARVYQGNVSAAIVRIGELFRDAVRLDAAGVIAVHNHPSGDLTPSPDDLRLTVEAVAAGALLDIPLLDHVIVGATGYASLREQGIRFADPPRRDG
jgi:DNA repair protein RadC